MKKRTIGTLVISLILALVMIFPLTTFVVSAEESNESVNQPQWVQDLGNCGRSPTSQAEYEDLKRYIEIQDEIGKAQEKLDKLENKLSKEKAKATVEGLKVVQNNLPGLVRTLKDLENGGDFDHAAMLDNAVSLISDIASIAGPAGMIVSGVLDLGKTIFDMAMGGEVATSATAQMEDRLSQQLGDIQNQLSGIEEQINGLSNEINESTNKIISEVTSAIDNADAKAYLRTFMLSGEGNFSYNQYRNYIYGTTENNSKANTAYYSLLKQSINNNASDEIVKYYYDQLYTSIMSDRDIYYDYIVGSDNSKSIVQYYYDVVSSRPDSVDKNGNGAISSAILFAYDIYQTELKTSQIIAACNFYQYSQMCLTDSQSYCYDKSSNKIVTMADIDGATGIDSIQEQINIRTDEIIDQLARDIAYILKLEDSYILESNNGVLFEIVNNDAETYGNVLVGQKVYLNKVPKDICEQFDFMEEGFSYEISVPTATEGVFTIDSNANSIQAKILYKETEVCSLSFSVGTSGKFQGGSGTASDPYLIANAEQFKLIANGLDKHYCLIADIDFNGETISPIGQRVNSSKNVVYDEFTGSLDGKGCTISNLNICGNTHAGLFGIIGNSGEIANLTLYNVKVNSNITYVEKSQSEFFAGMVAGKNNGNIKYITLTSDGATEQRETYVYDGIEIDDKGNFVAKKVYSYHSIPVSGVKLNVANSVKNRNINVYTGGIAGVNNYIISHCNIDKIQISSFSTHDFGGDATVTNKNNVYAGGICAKNYGIIGYSAVSNNTKMDSFAKSVYNPKTTVNPYVSAYAGGITGKNYSEKLSDCIVMVLSDCSIIRCGTDLECQSNWGAWYGNCKQYLNKYVPESSDEEIQKIKAVDELEDFAGKIESNYDVTIKYVKEDSEGKYEDYTQEACTYKAGSLFFNTDDLKIFINGVEKEYQILDIYGFDAQNESFESVSQNVTILFGVNIDGKIVYLTKDISVVIEENVVTSIEIINLKEFYVQDAFSIEGLVLQYNYAVGNSTYITINSENISEFRYFGNITTFGKQDIALLYGGDTIEFKINIICGHGNNFTSEESGYVYNEALSKNASCTDIGHKAYVCSTCGDIQYFYLRKTEHTPDYENAVDSIETTCTEEGNTGKIICIDCGTVLVDGEKIPKLNHSYIYLNEDEHICANGEHSEFHHYTITETVKQKVNSDGSQSWYIVYNYTCVCQKDGKVYSKEIFDENLIVNENTKLPTIIVSDGYALSAGDYVVVYVQLINNPGINAANFGIRYSEGLELVDIQDGIVLKGSLVTDGLAVNYGYNFVWGNDSYFNSDGNLLKLTFKVSDYAKLGDKFNVSLVYAIGNGAQGGFSTNFSNQRQHFITKDGTIKVVDRLPGDVNNDGVVDLLDAIEIGRFVVGKTDSIDETYANVDLSYGEGSNVDIMDMVAILQNITGGYGTNLLTQDFEIILNTNGYDKTLSDLLVSIYGENNTYSDAGLAELERNGYKFLGWYDQMVGGHKIDIDSNVTYNSNQKKQTLYAHWELNKLSFNSNGATSGEMDDVYFSGDYIIDIENKFVKEYTIAFVSDLDEQKFDNQKLKYELIGWQASNGKTYSNLDDAVNDLINAHYGNVTLTAIWSNKPLLTYPNWSKDGYENAILWSGDADFATGYIQPGISDENILNYTPINGVYKIYAKHTPIVYDIVFDFNGGTGTNIATTAYGHSVANPYNYKANASVVKTGYNFVNWKDNYGNEYESLQEIGYVVGATQGATVTLTAQWGTQTYTISFVSNGGATVTNKTYSVETIDSLSLPNIEGTYNTYPEYNKFEGWYANDGLTQLFDKATLKNNPENITLYAKWDLCDVITGISKGDTTNLNVENGRYIIDLSSTPSCDYNNATIYLQDIKEVYLIGKDGEIYSNLTISICNYGDRETMLSFAHWNMVGKICAHNNQTRDLKISMQCLEDSKILATNGNTAISGIADLTITGDGSLTVKGYDGAVVTTAGAKGNDGGVGISVDNLTVDMKGSLYVYGGNGSNGVDGVNAGQSGGAGGNGNSAIIVTKDIILNQGKITISSGNGGAGGNGKIGTQGAHVGGNFNNGGHGGNGGNGGNGGDSLVPIVAVNVLIDFANVQIVYGDAGDGGSGGNGGNGGDSSGNWGTAGNGGRGGNGGNAGKVNENMLTPPSIINKVETIINKNSKGGAGGIGGSGGAAGYGAFPYQGTSGSKGADGRNGGGYFNGHYYQFVETSITWENAKAECEKMGGYLATIASAEENAYVNSLIGGNYIWLGGNDIAVDGTWVWLSGGTFPTTNGSSIYTNWASGEPNNSGGNQDYLVMYSNGTWDDDGVTNRYYVCEFDN